MITWHTHIVPAEPNQTALIAVHCPMDDAWFLLGQIYRWCEKHNCWIGEDNRLKLKYADYFWLAETDLLRTIPV